MGPKDGPLFVILSFEGPDSYARAGGLASRIEGLSTALGSMGFETHLFFVGAPGLPGLEKREESGLVLHRWCQWISAYHPKGVYEGEEGKICEWTDSLPNWLNEHLIVDAVSAERPVFVLAEEWHTAASVVALDRSLRALGIRDRVQITWNANNVFGFDRIDWPSLGRASTVTTISRFMKQVLTRYEVDARVIPNGIPAHWLKAPSQPAVRVLRNRLRRRFVVIKIARWDPDKRWLGTVESLAELKRLGLRPLMIARGGMEAHVHEVIRHANGLGLTVRHVRLEGNGPRSVALQIADSADTDLLIIDSYLTPDQSKVLYRASDAVLANSRMEPFGLVGLEAMACGGIAVVGCTGEDYVTPWHDAISVQSDEPGELVASLLRVYWDRQLAQRMRRTGKITARRFAWNAVINRVLLPYLRENGLLRSLESRLGAVEASPTASTFAVTDTEVAKSTPRAEPVRITAATGALALFDETVSNANA